LVFDKRGQSFDSAIFKRRFREGEREIKEANIGGEKKEKKTEWPYLWG
jgi:hypothetical protein